MTRLVEAGGRAAMVYLVQREDCQTFAIARDIDPAYGAALDLARSAGVETLCYACRLSTEAIVLDRPLGLAI